MCADVVHSGDAEFRDRDPTPFAHEDLRFYAGNYQRGADGRLPTWAIAPAGLAARVVVHQPQPAR